MRYDRALEDLFKQFEAPAFSVRYWDGSTKKYGGEGAPAFTLSISDERTARRLFSDGAIGFGESYMSGALSIEGNLEAYLRLRHQAKPIQKTWRLAFARLHARLTSPFTRVGQISYHYDTGNDFFRRILDPRTMSYSCACFATGDESLEDAQVAKLERVSSWLGLPNGARVLDVGSGWGGFALHGAKRHGWRVDGVTLSDEQLAYANELVKKEGVDELVSLSYRDMAHDLPQGPYDGIVSLESIEHVGQAGLAAHIKSLRDRLMPGGALYLQFTGRYAPKPVDAWTLKYVFPGGYLPHKAEIINALERAGLSIDTWEDDTDAYIRTMSYWIANLERNREAITKEYGAPFYRLWELWMHGAKVSFEEGAMNLFRAKLARPA